MNKPTIQIDIVSDVVCPWCYIGKRRLEKAMSELSDQFQFEVRYKPFELNPQMPKEGSNQLNYLVNKFGSRERYDNITRHVAQVAAEEGLKFNFEIQSVSPNTLDAHRLLWLADQEGVQPAVKEALMKAYFEVGKNLADRNVLLAVVVEAGLERKKAEEVLNTNLFVREVKDAESQNLQRGVSGVPFFIINNQYGISGAQSPEVFVSALKEIGATVMTAGDACSIDDRDC